MPLSRLPYPSFSLILTAANGDALLTMQDFNPAPTSVRVSLQLPHIGGIATTPAPVQPSDHDPLMQSVDTRFHGQLAYRAHYATEAGKPSDEDDNQSETGTVFEPYPIGFAHELHALGESRRTRRRRRRPTCGNPPGLLKRLKMKFSAFWRAIRRMSASILCRNV